MSSKSSPPKRNEIKVVYDAEKDCGMPINTTRTKIGDKFVCPVVDSKGMPCQRQVKKLSVHIHNGHGPNGKFFYIEKAVRQGYVDVGKQTKMSSKKNSVVCPICKNKFSQIFKHMKNMHEIPKKEARTLILNVHSTTIYALDEEFYNAFKRQYLLNRISGASGLDSKGVQDIKSVQNIVHFLRKKLNRPRMPIEQLLTTPETIVALGERVHGFIDMKLKTCKYKNCKAVTTDSRFCKVSSTHSTYKPATVRKDLLSISKVLRHLRLNQGVGGTENKEGLQQILSSLKEDLSRRQKEIEKKKKNSGITEDDVDNYFISKEAIKAEKISWEKGSKLRKYESMYGTVKNHLITSLILENYGRSSEVRCMKISELAEAEAELAEDGSLFYVVNTCETKKRGCQVTLTALRKQQIEKFIADMRPHLIGEEKEDYIFGDVGGKVMSPSKFSKSWRGHFIEAGGNPLVAQNILRSVASSNVALYCSKKDEKATLSKMGHCKKIAEQHYQSAAKNGLAVKGLYAIKSAAVKNREKRRKVDSAVKKVKK